MQIYRKYGFLPLKVSLIHGEPGAIGEMEPVARTLAVDFGVLEPIQTETALHGQIVELSDALEELADSPALLVGFSWGAWLSYLVTAKYPHLVKKLILVGSGPYEVQYVSKIEETRMSRLRQAEREEYAAIIALFNDPAGEGNLKSSPAWDIPYALSDLGTAAGNQFHGVMKEAQAMRKDGSLLEFADRI